MVPLACGTKQPAHMHKRAEPGWHQADTREPPHLLDTGVSLLDTGHQIQALQQTAQPQVRRQVACGGSTLKLYTSVGSPPPCRPIRGTWLPAVCAWPESRATWWGPGGGSCAGRW
jgi:hypothetical protein